MKRLMNIFKKRDPITRITHFREHKYILIDCMLAIIAHKRTTEINELRYELLHCGLYVGYPTLKKAIQYLVDEKMFVRSNIGEIVLN